MRNPKAAGALGLSALRDGVRPVLRDLSQLQDPSPQAYPPLAASYPSPAAGLSREAGALRLLEQLFAVQAQYLQLGRAVVHLPPLSISTRAATLPLLTTVNYTLVMITGQYFLGVIFGLAMGDEWLVLQVSCAGRSMQ